MPRRVVGPYVVTMEVNWFYSPIVVSLKTVWSPSLEINKTWWSESSQSRLWTSDSEEPLTLRNLWLISLWLNTLMIYERLWLHDFIRQQVVADADSCLFLQDSPMASLGTCLLLLGMLSSDSVLLYYFTLTPPAALLISKSDFLLYSLWTERTLMFPWGKSSWTHHRVSQ